MGTSFGLIAVLILISSIVIVLAVAFGIRLWLNPERTARDRIVDLTGGAREESPLLQSEMVRSAASSIGKFAKPTEEEEINLLRRRLIQAGYRSRNNLEIFSGVRTVLALTLPLLFVLLGRPATTQMTLLFVLLGAAAGFYLPGMVLSSQVEGRQARLMKTFPDALDLLVSSVEAGLGMDASLRRVAKEIESSSPELARELQLVNFEVEAGVPRIEALRHLDTRTGLEEVNALVNVLAQAERFGTSVARALRVHSNLVRTKRMLAAEEKAAQLTPKLTVAMILFILPSLFSILLGPAVVNIVRTLLPTLQRQ